FLAFHRESAADVSLALAPVPDTSRFGTVETGPGGRLVRFREKDPGGGPGWVNAGVYLLGRSLVEEIPPGRPVALERDLLPGWAARKRCYGFPGGRRFLDIGTPESYARAEAFFRPEPASTTC